MVARYKTEKQGESGDTWLTERELADKIRMSVQSLRVWRRTGTGPRFVKIGHAVRYRASDVQAWIGTLPVGGGM